MELRAEAADLKEDVESSGMLVPFLGFITLAGTLLSPFAVAYGQLMFAPIITLLTGVICYSLLEKRRSKSFLKTCVLFGTVTACITGGWSFAETKFRNDVFYNTAGKFAEKWLTDVSQGKRELAFEMTINEGYRQLETMDLVAFYNADMKARAAMEVFFARPGCKAVVKRGKDAKWQYFSPRGIIKTQLGDVVKVAVQDISGAKPVTFVVALMRSTKEINDPSFACWYVMEVEVEV